MAENNIHDVNVDEIMKQIRAEVARRKAETPRKNGPDRIVYPAAPRSVVPVATPEIQESKAFRFAKKVQAKLRGYPFFDRINNTAKRLKRFIPQHQRRLAVADFLRLNDREFVEHAYRGICKREPDVHGLESYLSKLRDGRLSKIEILGRIRYSAEGRAKQVVIPGLLPRFILKSSYRIPIVGYVISFVTSFLRLPYIVRNMGVYEAATNAQFTRHHDISRELGLKIDHLQKNKAENQFAIQLADQVQDQRTELQNQRTSINDLQGSLHLLFDEMRTKLSEPLSADRVQNILAEEDHLLDTLYVVFEDRFRGSREVIKERAKVYLPYIQNAGTASDAGPVLDIGCGRGEWLELLKERSRPALGIDLNRTMVQQCRERGLEVREADAIRYLREQRADTFSAITGFHIVEHVPFKTLIQLFDESLRTLKPGGIVIFETPNPENLVVGACNFYLDPTHRNPVPPQLLHFVAEARKFEKTEILRVHPFDFFKETADAERVPAELRALLTTGLDYALIAYKPAKRL